VNARRVLITGTDTGIGKTMVSALIARTALHEGRRVAYMKPVETGIADDESAECRHVRGVAGTALTAVVGQCYREPLAPFVAAARAEMPVDLATLDRQIAQLADEHELLLIEGAGGLLVPVTETLSFRELAHRWGTQVLVVVGNRLGCLNHARLTMEALAQADLPVCGWVLNQIQPTREIAEVTNADELTRLLGPPLAKVPYQPNAQTAIRLPAI